MVLMMGMFGTAQSSLLAFPEERPVFLREFSTDHYAAFTYFLARLTMEAFVTFIQILITVRILCPILAWLSLLSHDVSCVSRRSLSRTL